MVIYARFSVEATVGYTSWWSLKMLRRTQHARARAGSWRHRTRVLTENRCHDVQNANRDLRCESSCFGASGTETLPSAHLGKVSQSLVNQVPTSTTLGLLQY